jgi:hypothetical protein
MQLQNARQEFENMKTKVAVVSFGSQVGTCIFSFQHFPMTAMPVLLTSITEILMINN